MNDRWSGSYDRYYEGVGGHWRDERGWDERELEGRYRGKALKKLVVPTFDGGEYFGLGFGKVRKILFEEDLNLVAMDPHAG